MMPASADVAELTIGIVAVSEATRVATMVAPATAGIERATFCVSILANDLAESKFLNRKKGKELGTFSCVTGYPSGTRG